MIPYANTRWNEQRCEVTSGPRGPQTGFLCTLEIDHEGDHCAYEDTGKVKTSGHLFAQWQNGQNGVKILRQAQDRDREDREVEQWLNENC